MCYRMPPKDSGETTRNPSLQGACEIPDNNSRRFVRMRSCENDRLSKETASERRELLNLLEHRTTSFTFYRADPVEKSEPSRELLLQRQKRKDFLHRIVTGDEKWIHYDNLKRRKSWGKPGLSTAIELERVTCTSNAILSDATVLSKICSNLPGNVFTATGRRASVSRQNRSIRRRLRAAREEGKEGDVREKRFERTDNVNLQEWQR
ncbi:MOS1T transposase, partial [Pseudoatta argentina]